MVDLSRRGGRSLSLTGRANGVRTLLFCLVVLPPQSEDAERSSSVVAKKGQTVCHTFGLCSGTHTAVLLGKQREKEVKNSSLEDGGI